MLPKIIRDTKYIDAPKPSLSMNIIRIEFQFSAVNSTNMVISEYAKVSKLNLNELSSLCGMGPLKNCMPIRAYIKMSKNISSPRFAMDENALSTVCNNFLRVVHDLTILKILNSLNARKTVRALEPAFTNSRRPTITIIASKTLKPSFTYNLKPRPRIFKAISKAKMQVKI